MEQNDGLEIKNHKKCLAVTFNTILYKKEGKIK